MVPTFACRARPPARTTPPPSAKQVVGVDGLEVAVDHELRAELGSTLLARFSKEDHIAVKGHPGALQRQHQHEPRDDAVLVVWLPRPWTSPPSRVAAKGGKVHFCGSTVTTLVCPITRIGRLFPFPLMRATRLGRCGSLEKIW